MVKLDSKRVILVASLFFIFKISFAQKLTGTVYSESDNQPITGATVQVKGSSNGAVTDSEGKYRLDNIAPLDSIVISSIGYGSKTVAVNNRAVLDIRLMSNISSLDQIVVVGYGTEKKINLTGSISSIGSDEIENRPLPNVGAAISGLSPNLNINLTGAMGGEPGSGNKWDVRGLGSINGDASPLILVDGTEMNIQNLNPQDIESVNILKDASASAIYGARAAFGVVLITTKKGKKDSKPMVQYNGNVIIGSPLGIPHYESSIYYATVVNQAAVNAGAAPNYPKEQMERIKKYAEGTYPYEYDPDNPPSSIWDGRRTGNANYDYPYWILKKNKVDYKHTVSVSGGTDKTQYYTSLGYYDEGGFYRFGYDQYKRYNVLANLNTDITDWLSFGINTKYSRSHTDYPIGITTVGRDYAFSASIYETSPITPIYNINGTLNSPNISNLIGAGRDKNDIDDYLITLRTDIEPVAGWITSVSYNYNLSNSHGTSNPKPVDVELGTGDIGNSGKPGTAYESLFSKNVDLMFNIVSSYEKSFDNHNLKLLLGFEQEENSFTSLNGRKDDLITVEVPSISTAIGATTLKDNMFEWATRGYFGRVNYNFKNKYLLELSGRYDGSSRFSPDSRWGWFPSGSIGYNLSEESFWSPIKPYINNLKLRASYGSLGNQNVDNYLYVSNIPFGSETPWIIGGERPPFANVPNLVSENLTWETVGTKNLGVDIGFAKERLTLSFDVYKRITRNMFGPQRTLPYTLGAPTPKANNATLQTNGFELIIKWRDELNKELTYYAQLGLGDNKSIIRSYRNENGIIDDWYAGKQVGEIWGFVSDGIIQTSEEASKMVDQSSIYPSWGAGDMRYKDINNDGKISTGARTLDDHGDLTIIGNSSPRYNITITGGLDWKGLDFNMQWSGVGKSDFFPGVNYSPFWGVGTSWSVTAIFKESPSLNYWRPSDESNILGPNTNSYLPKPYGSTEVNKNRMPQTRYLLNASYLRLRYMELGYTIPDSYSKKIFIDRARFYLSATNLLTLTGLPKAIDPIQGPTSYDTGGFYPVSRSFSFGINLSF